VRYAAGNNRYVPIITGSIARKRKQAAYALCLKQDLRLNVDRIQRNKNLTVFATILQN